MTDHGNPSISSGRELLALQGRKVVVIDHHRRSEDFVDSPVIAYVESSASSVAELVSELLSASSSTIPIYEAEATLMYLGLLVDTNRFKSHTSERTFQAAATLASWEPIQRMQKRNFLKTMTPLLRKMKLFLRRKCSCTNS